MNNNILDIGATAAHDNSIIKKDFYTYTPYTNFFGESEEIRVAIQNHDSYLLPCESYIYMQLNVKTENHVETTPEKDRVKFIHNFPSFLFSDACYELNGVEIDRIKNVGVTSTMKLAAASSKSNTIGYYQFNKIFAEKDAESKHETVVYDVLVPLSIWFGFCDDFRKTIVHCRHELILKREGNNLNCVRGGSADPGKASVKIEITKLEWMMPHITLADKIKLDMKNYLSKNKNLAIQHRSWDMYEYPELPQTTSHVWSVKTVSHVNKPRFVLVGFHHNKKGKKIEDSSKFNSMHITNLRLYLNSQVYPYNMHDVDISGGKFAELYNAYANIQSSYYTGGEDQNLFAIDYKDFQTNTLFAFDTSRSDETVKNGSVDIRIELNASENMLPNTTAYCLIIYENEFTYSPLDGIVSRSM